MIHSQTMNSNEPYWTPEDEAAIREKEFAEDIALQLTQLREQRGFTQEELAERARTTQQAISRYEDDAYGGHSLRKLREVARAMRAYVAIVFVPFERLRSFLPNYYLPVIDEAPASQQTSVYPAIIAHTEGRTEVPGVTNGSLMSGFPFAAARETVTSAYHADAEPAA